MIWRCDITNNPVDTDTRMVGAGLCECQGCRAGREIRGLWNAIECARNSIGYTNNSDDRLRNWFDNFFPKEPGQPPPFDLTDPRYKPDASGWIGGSEKRDGK
jgi:hypothetical protein